MGRKKLNPADDTIRLTVRLPKHMLDTLDERRARFNGMSRSGMVRYLLDNDLAPVGQRVEEPEIVPAQKRLLVEASGTHRCRRHVLIDDEVYDKGQRYEQWACTCGKILMKRYGA